MRVTVHHWPSIPWHQHRVLHFVRGLEALGLEVQVTSLQARIDEHPAVLFGTSFFHLIEQDEYPSLLVDRASWGDPDQVQLVWNGRLRRGDHRVPDNPAPRAHPEPKPFRNGKRVVLCGQYTPNGAAITLQNWYYQRVEDATHFKPHPAASDRAPGGLPLVEDFKYAGTAITLNSSVGLECLFNGVDVIVDDPGAMLYPYSQGDMGLEECLNWIAWTQWDWREIEAGTPIKHHFFDGEDYRF